jgi:hypothetical protein
MNEKEIHFLSHNHASLLVSSIRDKRHKCLILLMLDAGLRVSEAVSLTFGDFNFHKKTLTVKSLKKREIQSKRIIPLSQRLYFCLVEYAKEFQNLNTSIFLFPNPQHPNKHIERDAVYKFLHRLSIKKLNIPNLHPHALRHSFATSLVATGSNLHEIADLLGHSNLDTTRIYTHIPQERLQQSVLAAASRNGDRRWFRFLFAKRPPTISIMNNNTGNVIIGRNSEIQTLTQHAATGTNVILLGAPGVGKRTILDAVSIPEKKVLTFDDTASIKTSLVYLLLYLYNGDKAQIANLMFKNFDSEKTETRLTRQSVAYLCDAIKEIVQPKEYILKIKQFDNITPQSMKAIERLKDTFVIITAATEIPFNKASFLWNFEKIEIKNLNRIHTFEMIHKLSFDLAIDDYEIFRNHILNQSDGNPRAVAEMIERYRREPELSPAAIRNITHQGALREWDFSYLVILLIASVAVARYMTSEFNNPGLRTIGGIAMITLLTARVIFSRMKRRII